MAFPGLITLRRSFWLPCDDIYAPRCLDERNMVFRYKYHGKKIDMRINRKYLFLIVNFIMLAGMMLSETDFFLADAGTKIKYLFMLYCLIDIFQYRKNNCGLNLIILFLILTAYILLWRYVFVNPDMKEYISAHTLIMMYYLLILIPSVQEVLHYQCIKEYTITSCAAIIAALFFQVITHRHELSLNPIFAVYSFLAHDVMRSSFGFLHANYVGNMCFLLISFLLVFYLEFSENPLLHSRSKMIALLLTCIIFMILFSASSRTAFISIVIFVLGTCGVRTMGKVRFTKESKRILIRSCIIGLVLFVVVLFTSGLWNYIWVKSNRSLNVTENVHWVPIIGNIWTGMGFVDNGAFISDPYNANLSAFGVQTSSLDMNYIYIYCSTGILGCCVMAFIMIFLGVSLYKNRGQQYGGYYLVLYITLLFYAFWETILFTYRFWGMIIPHVILLYGANRERVGICYQTNISSKKQI